MANLYNSQLDAFSLYHETQSSTPSKTPIGPALPALGHALAGSTGTAISNLAIYPLDLIITRLQVQRSLQASPTSSPKTGYDGLFDAFEKIYTKEGGLKAFYSGVWQDTGKSITDSFLFFLFYNYLRSRRLQKNGTKSTTLPALEELLVGAIAGGFSKFFTTPISNIVTRKQTASFLSPSSSPESTVAEIIEKIKTEKGIQGFWSGYSASLVLTLNPSLTFFLYELFKRSFLPRSKRDDPGARITFLMAAVAKACASTVTYPFSLAKARAQASSSPPVDSSTTSELKDDISSLKNNESSSTEKEQTAKAAATKAKTAAKRNNVFTEILHIYHSEGIGALYEGVYGEILKGFFSHGITMLVKGAIHKLIIKTYFAILKALNKFPSPAQLAKDAQEKAHEGKEHAERVVKDSYERLSEAAVSGRKRVVQIGGDAVERAGNLGSNAVTVGQNAVESLKPSANNAAQNTTETVKNAGERIQNVTETLREGAGNAISSTYSGNNTVQPAKEVIRSETVQNAGKVVSSEELKSQDAGHLLSNAQEQLGDQIVKAGQGVKGSTVDGGKK